jgi:peptidoglycan/LPS O-acetylase OafA/YrhL
MRGAAELRRVLATLVVVAGLILGVIVYIESQGSSDGQQALVWPFLIFWTGLALFVVWALDRLLGGPRRRR